VCVVCVGAWGMWGCVGGVWGAWRCGGVGSLLTFDIPQTALVATLDTYDFKYVFSKNVINVKSLILKYIFGRKIASESLTQYIKRKCVSKT
jgi:hypothetical protein